ncbi:cytochrome c biogenesis protein ResB [Bacteroides xylanisolvens]|uniref:cytochrome c biogenesis protein ResB n=1 Tax=Bacteroides xylanisolvens TaxID=371601 RepID=UPI0018994D82|nr:cytochrome c biogenesis protein ResB [Bacteroides xylanisolvens]
MRYIYTTGYILLAIAMQLFTGNFPVSFLSFPLNIIFAGIWLVMLWILHKEYKKSFFTRLLCSPQTSVLSIGLFISGCLVIGLLPQLSDISAKNREGILAQLGCYNFMTSWIFIAILFLLLSNLGMITIHAFQHRKRARWRFILNHAGLWLALFAGFLGSSDTQTLRIPIYRSEPAHEAFDMNGTSHYLDYEIELNSFTVEYYPNRRPSRFAANVRLGNKKAVLEVNHPYAYRLGEDVYLTGYDVMKGSESEYCILQVVKQPWKYVIVAGILMMLAGAVLLFINGPEAYDKLG